MVFQVGHLPCIEIKDEAERKQDESERRNIQVDKQQTNMKGVEMQA